MYKNLLFFLTLSALIGAFTIAARPIGNYSQNANAFLTKEAVTGLTVTVTSASSVALSWSAWPGAGDYTVTVLNLTTNQVEKSFSTSSTSSTVNNLSSGNTYRFSVEKAGYVITEDVIM